MKIAVSHWQGRISPVFDVAQELLLIDFEVGRILNKINVSLSSGNPFARTEQMVALEIRLLICGAISKEHENVLRSEGIQVVAFTCGPVDGILDALVGGCLDDCRFRMPGFSNPSGATAVPVGKVRRRSRRRGKPRIQNKRS